MSEALEDMIGGVGDEKDIDEAGSEKQVTYCTVSANCRR